MAKTTTTPQEQLNTEPEEKSTCALVLSGYTLVIGNTKKGEVTLRVNEFNEDICMSITEANMLSLALRHAIEEIAE
ncbi:hypothetical protein [Rhizobium phage RHEph24]|nr:hypothetical protein [Rhizobium phage RHEph24]